MENLDDTYARVKKFEEASGSIQFVHQILHNAKRKRRKTNEDKDNGSKCCKAK